MLALLVKVFKYVVFGIVQEVVISLVKKNILNNRKGINTLISLS